MAQDGPPYLLEFFAYETIGASVGHVGGLSRVDFDVPAWPEREEDMPRGCRRLPLIPILGDLHPFANFFAPCWASLIFVNYTLELQQVEVQGEPYTLGPMRACFATWDDATNFNAYPAVQRYTLDSVLPIPVVLDRPLDPSYFP